MRASTLQPRGLRSMNDAAAKLGLARSLAQSGNRIYERIGGY
jgi:hypothetical protein